MYERIAGYELRDVEFAAAFDVDRGKMGAELSKAIVTPPTMARVHVDVEPSNVVVEAGPLLDGLDGLLSEYIEADPAAADVTIEAVAKRLTETGADVLVCLLPTGAREAVQAYATAAAHAGVGFVNATPEPVARETRLARLFERRRAPLLGDDLRSHLGATTLHTALIGLMRSRGLRISNTYQLNVGGNTDFLNLSDPGRARGKIGSKRRALAAAGIDAETVSAGPNGYVEHLGDSKVCFLRLEAESILDTNVSLEVRMEVEDSPNAAGVLVNAVRVAKAAKDRAMSGVVDPVCPFLFKSPPHGAAEIDGLRQFDEFVAGLETASAG